MKRLMTAILPVFLFSASAQVTITDNFSTTTNFIDLSKLHQWGAGPFPLGTSGFQISNRTAGTITYPSISLTSDALLNTGYVTSTSLKTASAIDYKFPSVASRLTGDVTIEFDAVWNVTSGGESGRLVVFLLSSYPAGGPQVNDIDNVGAAHPFGLPAYNIRLRNSTAATAPLMLYGGSTVIPGEFEKYNGTWWLPGFATDAGGVSPGTAADYPVGATKIGNGSLSANSISTTVWKHYTWKIKQERVELYVRNSSQTPASDVLIAFMQTPSTGNAAQAISEINAAHGSSVATLPPNYSYYNNFTGVRFYWRGASNNNTNLANVSITYNSSGTLPVNWYNLKAKRIYDNHFSISGNLVADDAVQELQTESSDDGHTTVKGKTKQVNILAGETYSFTEDMLLTDDVKKVRLKAVYANGRFSYSNWLPVSLIASKTDLYHIPGTGYLMIANNRAESMQLLVYSSDGRLVSSKHHLTGTSVMISDDKLVTGQVYIIKLQTGNQSITKKITW
jgi:hypothetical protein